MLSKEDGRSAVEQTYNRSQQEFPIEPLEVVFVGNKRLQADGTWGQLVTPDFANDGLMEVVQKLQDRMDNTLALVPTGARGAAPAPGAPGAVDDGKLSVSALKALAT